MAIVIDATDAVVGRLCARVAKTLIENEAVVIVNAEKAVFSGTLDFVVNKYKARRQMTDKANPDHGAKWPRRPDFFLRRVIRGMLPKRHTRMKASLSRLRVYLGTPSDVQGAQSFECRTPSRVVTVEKVCRRLGWNGLAASIA